MNQIDIKSIMEGAASTVGEGAIAWVVAKVFDEIFGNSVETEILENLKKILNNQYEIMAELQDISNQVIWENLKNEVTPHQQTITNYFDEYQELAVRRKTAKHKDLKKLREDARVLRNRILDPGIIGVHEALVALNQILTGKNPLENGMGLLQMYIKMKSMHWAEKPTSCSLDSLGKNINSFFAASLNLQWMGAVMLVGAQLSNHDKGAAKSTQQFILKNFKEQLLQLSKVYIPQVHASTFGETIPCRIRIKGITKEKTSFWFYWNGGLFSVGILQMEPIDANNDPGRRTINFFLEPRSKGSNQEMKIYTGNGWGGRPGFYQNPGTPFSYYGNPTYIIPKQTPEGWRFEFSDGKGKILDFNFSGEKTQYIKNTPSDEKENSSSLWDILMFQKYRTIKGWSIILPGRHFSSGDSLSLSGAYVDLPDSYVNAWLFFNTCPADYNPGLYCPLGELSLNASNKWEGKFTLPTYPSEKQLKFYVCIMLVDSISNEAILNNPGGAYMKTIPGGLVICSAEILPKG